MHSIPCKLGGFREILFMLWNLFTKMCNQGVSRYEAKLEDIKFEYNKKTGVLIPASQVL